MRVVFVHGACIQDGAWWWHRTAGLLDPSKITVTTQVYANLAQVNQPDAFKATALMVAAAYFRDIGQEQQSRELLRESEEGLRRALIATTLVSSAALLSALFLLHAARPSARTATVKATFFMIVPLPSKALSLER